MVSLVVMIMPGEFMALFNDAILQLSLFLLHSTGVDGLENALPALHICWQEHVCIWGADVDL